MGRAKQDRVGREDQDAADVMQPLADIETVNRHQRDGNHHRARKSEGGKFARGNPRGGWAEHVIEIGGNDENDGRRADNGVNPQVPCGEESRHFAEALLGPLI